jgi:hypothetical protein
MIFTDDPMHNDFEETVPVAFASLEPIPPIGRDGPRAVWAIRCATRLVEVRRDLDLRRARGVADALWRDAELRRFTPELVAESMRHQPLPPA